MRRCESPTAPERGMGTEYRAWGPEYRAWGPEYRAWVVEYPLTQISAFSPGPVRPTSRGVPAGGRPATFPGGHVHDH
jgi:hypothetical protein